MDPDVYKLVFGKVIAALRKSEGLSQEEFADAIEVSQPTLSRIERGKVLPDVFTYKLMAEALDRSVGELDETIDDTLEQAERAAAGFVGEGAAGNNFWAQVLGAVGVVALGGLIGFAVANMVNDRES